MKYIKVTDPARYLFVNFIETRCFQFLKMSLLSRIHARSLSFFPNYSIGKARTTILPLKIIHKNSTTCFQSSKILSEKTGVKYFSTSQPKKFWPQLKIISMILINPILRYSSWAVGKILKKHWGRLPLEQRQRCFTFALSQSVSTFKNSNF